MNVGMKKEMNNKLPSVECSTCEYVGVPYGGSAGGFVGLFCNGCHEHLDIISEWYNIYTDTVCSHCRYPTILNGKGRQCECKTLVNYYRKFRLWFWQVRTGKRGVLS